jgi:hypothetical protein
MTVHSRSEVSIVRGGVRGTPRGYVERGFRSTGDRWEAFWTEPYGDSRGISRGMGQKKSPRPVNLGR